MHARAMQNSKMYKSLNSHSNLNYRHALGLGTFVAFGRMRNGLPEVTMSTCNEIFKLRGRRIRTAP